MSCFNQCFFVFFAETQVNGKMENCGGDQRLPPDGDEFPSTYQEFGACTSEQYHRYVGASSRSATRSNHTATSNGAGLAFDDSDEPLSSMNSATTTKNNKTTKTRALRENSSSSYLKTNDSAKPLAESQGSPRYIAANIERETFSKPPEVSSKDTYIAEEKKHYSSPSVITRLAKTNKIASEPLVVVSEKTFEISDYYDEEPKLIEDIVDQDHAEGVPPPLPLTRPPKIDSAPVHQMSNKILTAETVAPRKYSLNGDLWRQDDKSERSVRDKIAMFSLQSSLEAPLFPSQAPQSPAAATLPAHKSRRLSKYKSSDDVFGDEKTREANEDKFFAMERTRSSVDLTDSGKVNNTVNETMSVEHYGSQRAPSLPKTMPPDEPTTILVAKSTTPPVTCKKPTVVSPTGNSSTVEIQKYKALEFNNTADNGTSPMSEPEARIGDDPLSSVFSKKTAIEKDNTGSDAQRKSARSIPSTLARATSFSGESTYINSENSQSAESTTSANTNGQISRTNSLASTFRRNSEDMRRQSLNQLIEQRRKGISKLRGLVIPQKNAVAVDTPIIDLPEIKSRDSILLHQVRFRKIFVIYCQYYR